MPKCEVGSKMRPDIRFGLDIIIAFWTGLDSTQVASARGDRWHGVLREEQRKMEVINDTEIESNCNGPLDGAKRLPPGTDGLHIAVDAPWKAASWWPRRWR